ncbi:MAG: hypothetical protein ACXABD_15345 [Candidatus Thorarchaeota archaeon]|jgi:hypothetical protein
MEVKNGGLMISYIEKMVPLLVGQTDIKSGGLMADYIEKMGLLLNGTMEI